MLDTGIDVPEVVNLLFFKLVRSKTKFWQMVGRGARLCRDLFGPGFHKSAFYLFDYCQNLKYFGQNPGADAGSADQSLGKRLFVQRLELLAELDIRLPGAPPPASAKAARRSATRSTTPNSAATWLRGCLPRWRR